MKKELFAGHGIVDAEDLMPHEAEFYWEGAHDLEGRPLPEKESGRAPLRENPLVLIVEDETELANLLEYHLLNCGYETTVAQEGRTALQIALARRPNLILLDLMLPELHGFEVCELLRQNQATHQIPILLLTAMDSQEDKLKGFSLGADDYITKPFEIRELLSRVKAVLHRTYPQS